VVGIGYYAELILRIIGLILIYFFQIIRDTDGTLVDLYCCYRCYFCYSY
jgi:hypothetical protein